MQSQGMAMTPRLAGMGFPVNSAGLIALGTRKAIDKGETFAAAALCAFKKY